MRVWIINPFDPLPGESEHSGRFAHLAYTLSQAGHKVTWWTAEFSHRFKKCRDMNRFCATAQERGIEVRSISVPAYSRNISLRRLWSHHAFGSGLGRAMTHAEPPDVIAVSAPPLDSASEATRFGADHGIPTVVDIIDQWPDTFTRALPRIAQPFRKVGFYPYYRAERAAYQRATGIIGVAQGFLNRGLEVGGPKEYAAVLHLGVDLNEFDQAMHRATSRTVCQWDKGKDDVWFLYGGTISHSYDIETVLHAAARSRRQYGQRVRFVIAGDGELGPRIRALHAELALDNVVIPGFLPLAGWAELLSRADVGLVAILPESLAYMPTKIFDYLAGGLAILNTVPGECATLMTDHRCGLNYRAGDVDDLFSAIVRVVEDADERRAMGLSARRLAETVFDKRIISARYVKLLEDVANRRS